MRVRKQGGGSKKGQQMVKHQRSGKCRKAFISCVKRTGRWRGHPASLEDLKEKLY